MSDVTTPQATPRPLVAFERRHIRPIPENERHGTARGLFFVWLGINMLPLTVFTGALGPTLFGLSLGWTVTAIVVGNLLGGIGAALHASQGPQLGIPQMLQARGQFGYLGGSLLALIALIMFLGFFASNLVVAAQSFTAALGGGSVEVGIVVCALVALAVAIFGYDLVRKLMAVFSVIIGVLVVVSIILSLANPATFVAHTELGYNAAGFFGMLAIGVTWQLAYAPYVSDYSRTCPRTAARSPRSGRRTSVSSSAPSSSWCSARSSASRRRTATRWPRSVDCSAASAPSCCSRSVSPRPS
ncbi:purine-cytosine permease-like protein [Pseudoclavibacter chungangensis]|nr:purine-cytosine permease-like protein [Pseudoclavibacter chungangensis]